MPVSCPLANLTDGPLWPAATSTALEHSQPTQPWPTPLPKTLGSHNVVGHCRRTLPYWGAAGSSPGERGQMLPPHHHQERGEGKECVSFWIDQDRPEASRIPERQSLYENEHFTRSGRSKKTTCFCGFCFVFLFAVGYLRKERDCQIARTCYLSMHTLSLAYFIYWLCQH